MCFQETSQAQLAYVLSTFRRTSRRGPEILLRYHYLSYAESREKRGERAKAKVRAGKTYNRPAGDGLFRPLFLGHLGGGGATPAGRPSEGGGGEKKKCF